MVDKLLSISLQWIQVSDTLNSLRISHSDTGALCRLPHLYLLSQTLDLAEASTDILMTSSPVKQLINKISKWIKQLLKLIINYINWNIKLNIKLFETRSRAYQLRDLNYSVTRYKFGKLWKFIVVIK